MRFYVTKDQDSWIEIHSLSSEMRDFVSTNYDAMFAERPIDQSYIHKFHRTTNLWEHEKVSRRYDNYLHTPNYDPTTHKSYMFNNSGYKVLPQLFQPLYEEMLQLDPRYNQVVINYYKDGSEFINTHSDCTAKMVENHSISICSLNEDVPRTMIFQAKNSSNTLFEEFSIKLESGQILVMGGAFQNNYKHGIPQELDIHTSRIGLTFRMMNEELCKNT